MLFDGCDIDAVGKRNILFTSGVGNDMFLSNQRDYKIFNLLVTN